MENRTAELTPPIGSVERSLTDPIAVAEKTPEQIEQEMLQTRQSLTEKVAAVESQVLGSVHTAADTLKDTVDAVKSFIHTAPGAVSDGVKQAASVVSDKMKEVFDISGHVRENPWASVGVSAGVGFITGLLVFRERTAAQAAAPMAPSYAAAPSAAPSSPGIFGDLLQMLGRKVRELAETAIDSASTAVNQNVRAGVPKLVDAAAEATGNLRFTGGQHNS